MKTTLQTPEQIEERLKTSHKHHSDTHAFFMPVLGAWFIGSCIIRAAEMIVAAIKESKGK